MTQGTTAHDGTALQVGYFPGETWHYLAINGSTMSLPRAVRCVQSGEALPHAMAEAAAAIQTGLGGSFDAAFDELLAESGGRTLYIQSSPDVCAKTHRKVELCATGGESLVADYFVRARRGSDSFFVFVIRGDDEGVRIGLRVRVLAEAASRVHVAVVNLAAGGQQVFCSLGASVANGARLDVSEVQLAKAATWSGTHVDLAGDESRFGGRAFCLVQEAGFLDMNQVVLQRGRGSESHFGVDHVLLEGATKTWRGTIDFRRGCVGSVGDENESVLLFGDAVQNKSLPVILCDEEAVEGRHGCSIGQLDEAALFYMRSRGLDESAAKRLVVAGKVEWLLRHIADEAVASQVHQMLEGLPL